MLLDSLKKFENGNAFAEIVILMPDEELEAGRQLLNHDRRIRLLGDAALIPSISQYPARPWKKQQLLKLSFYQRCLTPYFITLDPDNFATRDFMLSDLFRSDRAVMTFEPQTHHQEWWQDSCALIGGNLAKLPASVMTVTPCIYKCDIVKSLRRHIEILASKDWADFLLNDHHSRHWVEHGLYFAFMCDQGILASNYFDHTEFSTPRLHSHHNIWFGGDLDRWDVARCFEDSGRGIFAVVQSNTLIDPALVRERVAAFLFT